MARSNGDLVAKARADGARTPGGGSRRSPRRARCSGAMSALAGLRVLDLTRLLPGGFCSLLLADFGADVIKVEDTGAGDYARADPPAFASLNRGKRSVQHRPQDATAGATRSCGWRATPTCVLESFRPGVMDRLGVGYERLREENPRLVYCAITGYGQDGPFARARRPRHSTTSRGSGCSA